MKIKSSGKRVISGFATLVLIAAGSIFPSSTSSAAGLPTIRVITPVFNVANETFASDGLAEYYAVGGRSFFKYVGAGSTITITLLRLMEQHHRPIRQ